MTMELKPGPSPKLMQMVDEGKAIIVLHKQGVMSYYTIWFDTDYMSWKEVYA